MIKKRKTKKKKKISFAYINTFTKWITAIWLFAWLETLLFSELATMFSFGDVLSIQYINDNVKEIGLIIVAFYMSSKTLENCAKGFEAHREKMAECRNDDEAVG